MTSPSENTSPLAPSAPSAEQASARANTFSETTDDGRILSAISAVTNRYHTREKLGQGASAEVFRALDTRFNRDVALKRFTTESLGAAPAESDYLSEVAAVSQLSHPNVVRAYDLDDDEDGPFITFELIEGMNLEEKLAHGTLDIESARHFIAQALEALIHVHQKGLIHLDLKPANVMVTETACGIPHYTLIDFGRACDSALEQKRRESKGKKSLRGSIHYMAPEQFTNGVLTPRTDLYAIGAVTYELLTGQRPFEGDNAVQVMAAHLTGRVQPIEELLPNLPSGMAPWIMSLIAQDAEVRPTCAAEALKSFLSLSTLQFAPLQVREPQSPFERRTA